MTHTLAIVFLLGGIYGLFAFGATLKQGAAGHFDLSHAALLGVSAGTCALALSRGAAVWVALLEGTLAGAVTGLAVDRIVLWPLRLRNAALGDNAPLAGGAAAFAILLSWPNKLLGTDTVAVDVQRMLHGFARHVDSASMPWIGGAACVVVLLLGAFVLRATRFGLAIRALAANAEGARAAGVDSEWTIAQTAFMASGFGAFAGLMFAAFWPLPTPLPVAMGVLAACAINGNTSLTGAVVAGYVVAALEVTIDRGSIGVYWLPIVAAAMVLCAFAAPRGFFANRTLRPAPPR